MGNVQLSIAFQFWSEASEVNLPKLPPSPHWLPLQSHQSQSTHTTFTSDEAKMEDALEHAPTINVSSFHKTRLDLFGHQTALKKDGVDTRASSTKCSTLQIHSYWYSLFAREAIGSMAME